MLKNKISILSSSYIIPNHYSWKDNFKNEKIFDFKYVNNLNHGFHKVPRENILFSLIFVNDLINENKIYNNTEIKQISRSIINLVKIRLKTSNSPIIIFLVNYKSNNIFDYLSKKNHSEIIFDTLFNELLVLSKNYSNLILLNFNSLIENSKKNIFDQRNWYLANCRLSSDGHDLVCSSLKKIINKINSPAKKALILDCDNTLWGGIIGEDGIKNIKLGQDGIGKAFLDFQKKIKKITQNGTLLCIASKNNYEDVIDVLKNHNQMQIKKEDLVSIKVNWKEKYLNIKEIATDLNISLDSMVFWDDNPLERSKIKKFLPEVHVVNPDKEVVNWPEQINNLDIFSKIKNTKEDKNKFKQYKIRSRFIDEKKIAKDEIKYLNSIKLNPKIINLNKDNIARAAQMSQKTNQFNLRTIRYSISDIQQLSKKKNIYIKLVELSDLYGDHGIVGLIILKKINNSSILIDTFLISCRVFGRHLETWMIYQIKKICKKMSIKNIYGEHILTPKNKNICKNFFLNHSFNKNKTKISIKSKKGDLYYSDIKNIKNNMIKVYD